MRHYWLDRIVHLEPGVRATGLKAVALAEDEFEAHFPGNPILPGVYLLEGLAQTAGVLIEQTVEGRQLGLLTTVERARFQAFVRPGDQVRLEAELESLEAGVARVRATATVGDTTVASARLTFKLVSPDRLIPPVYQPFWRQTVNTWLGRYTELGDE
jgi:3-hydroxymyristoyl/3-hydroxydecanoyl-(acyl carrier protein) dehydratase